LCRLQGGSGSLLHKEHKQRTQRDRTRHHREKIPCCIKNTSKEHREGRPRHHREKIPAPSTRPWNGEETSQSPEFQQSSTQKNVPVVWFQAESSRHPGPNYRKVPRNPRHICLLKQYKESVGNLIMNCFSLSKFQVLYSSWSCIRRNSEDNRQKFTNL